MNRRTAALAALSALTAGALALTGCSGGSSGGTTGDTAPTVTDLKIGNFLDVTDWDPAGADVGFDGPYLSAVYDPLVRLDADGAPRAGLATEWEYDDDRTTLTMHLRDGVTFSDGEKFDADAAVAGLEHLIDGTTSGDAYRSVDSVEKVDEDTIVIHLAERDDSLLYQMGSGRSWMAAPKAIEADTLSKEPVGSGPYTLDVDDSVPGSHYAFTKVDDYWDADDFPFTTLSITPITDNKARQNAMISGQTNVSFGSTTDLAQAKSKGWNIAQGIASWVGIQFTDRAGDDNAALGDVRVRRAIAHAFDGAAILKSIGDGAGAATDQLFASGGPINDPALDDRYGKDVAKAKKLMAEAGYANGFSVKMPMSPIFTTWQAVAEQGLASIGIHVDWVDMQMPDYQKTAAKYPMFLAVLVVDSDPTTTVARQVASAKWYNPNAERDLEAYPEVKKLVERVESTQGEEQTKALQQLDEELVDQVWADVWYQANNIYYSVPGITVTPVTGLQFPTLDFISQEH